MTSYIVEATDGSGYARNGLRFATESDARAWAEDLMCRWLACRETRITTEPTEPEHELCPHCRASRKIGQGCYRCEGNA